MKVREIIELECWQDGSGVSYSEVYSDKFIDVEISDFKRHMNWNFWEIDDADSSDDIHIKVSWFPIEPLFSWSIWESDLRAMRR